MSMTHISTSENEIISEEFYKFLSLYFSQYYRSKDLFFEAISTSRSELKDDLYKIISSRKIQSKSLLKLSMNFFESGIWVSKSGANHLLSVVNLPKLNFEFSNGSDHDDIINCISLNKKSFYNHEQIFTAVFEELNYHYFDPHYKTKLKFPKINAVLGLIPGFVHEMYRQVPFQRAAENISENYGIQTKILNISGSKNSNHNSEILKNELYRVIESNPDKKIWLLAFSKGGIDALHFLKENVEFSNKHICGLSTIASPILGNHRAHNPLINILTPKELLAKSSLNSYLGLKKHKVIHPLKKSLSPQYQSSWFKRNHENLPEIFYSSLALESQWYQSHFWMFLAKLFFQSKEKNDGVIDVKDAKFPDYFKSYHFGKIKGHHLIGLRYSQFNQEALLESYIISLNYLGLLN